MNSASSPWLRRLALATALATLGLIGMGGLVTSKGAGMAVPDWPTTYGYNMFFFPLSQWTGGIFYEHSHRLWASVVGLLTALLTGWIWARESRGTARWVGLAGILLTLGLMGVRTQGMFVALAVVALGVIAGGVVCALRDPRPLRWWAAVAFAAVLVQGVLGGLRVTALKDELGIVHGTFAQLFLVLIWAIALSQTAWWTRRFGAENAEGWWRFRHAFLLLAGLTLLQLILGASMRHQHAGLAVPDFPLAHGRWWPATDPASLDAYNRARLDVVETHPITAAHIHLHMTHRLVAVVLLGGAVWLAVRTRRALGAAHGVTRFARLWCGLVMVQAAFGAFTVLSNKAADIATLHVVLGAVTLLSMALSVVGVWGMRRERQRQPAGPVNAPGTAAARAGGQGSLWRPVPGN
jgi:cytochrome c oxidase assembly protein subunit 15